jgi:hypothetical protein
MAVRRKEGDGLKCANSVLLGVLLSIQPGQSDLWPLRENCGGVAIYIKEKKNRGLLTCGNRLNIGIYINNILNMGSNKFFKIKNVITCSDIIRTGSDLQLIIDQFIYLVTIMISLFFFLTG